MNILIVPPNDLIENVLPNRLYHLARNWEQRHSLYLLRYPYYPTSTDIVRRLRRSDITFKARPSNNPSAYYVRNAGALYESLKRLMEREHLDVVVHANILPSFFANRLASKFKIRAIFDYIDHYPQSVSTYYENRMVRGLIRTIVSAITIYNLRNSDRIVAVSYTLKQTIRKYTKRPIHVIPNGVDTHLFQPLPQDGARKELSLESYDPILLYYGSIAEWVDYGALLKLTAKLKSRYPKMLLLLVGKIYNRLDKLKIMREIKYLDIENNVRILRPQPQDRIPVFIAAADIVYAPFKGLLMNCGTPVKILETISCMRPVVAAELDEFKLWFRNFLFYYENITDLEGLTLKLLNEYEQYRDLLTEARSYVMRNFEWKTLAQRYEKVFLCE